MPWYYIQALKVHPTYRGVEQLVARRAHNPEVVGSSPASATIKTTAFAVVFLYFYNFLLRNEIYQNSFDTNFDTNAGSGLVLFVVHSFLASHISGWWKC